MTLKAATAATAAIAAPHAAKKRSSKSKDVSQDEAGAYAVQVGIFDHPDKVREALNKAADTINYSTITPNGRQSRNNHDEGYARNKEAQDGVEQFNKKREAA